MEIKYSATRVNGIDYIVRVITGQYKPAVVLKLFDECPECLLTVWC